MKRYHGSENLIIFSHIVGSGSNAAPVFCFSENVKNPPPSGRTVSNR